MGRSPIGTFRPNVLVINCRRMTDRWLRFICDPPSIPTLHCVGEMTLTKISEEGSAFPERIWTMESDRLCARYSVDRSHRTQHGALLDAERLAAVYIDLTTTRQAALQFDPIAVASSQPQRGED